MSKTKFFLGLALILLVVGGFLFFEFIPNPLLKPSMSADLAILDTKYNFLLVFVTIRNPTHEQHTLYLYRVDMKMMFSDAAGNTQTLSREVDSFWGGYTVTYDQYFGLPISLTDIRIYGVTLDPCKAVGESLSVSDFILIYLSDVQKGTVNIVAQFALDGQETSSSSQVEVLVNPKYSSNGTQTTTTSSSSAVEPSQCLLAWNVPSVFIKLCLGAIAISVVVLLTRIHDFRRSLTK